MRTTIETTLTEAVARPVAQRMFAVQEHITTVLGYSWAGPVYAPEQRQAIAQAITELQAALAELGGQAEAK